MSAAEPLAVFDYQPGKLSELYEFLKRTRDELRSIRKIRISTTFLRVIDVNADFFEIRGFGYQDADAEAVLQNLNVAFKPDSLATPLNGPYKEFGAGKRYPWGYERVM